MIALKKMYGDELLRLVLVLSLLKTDPGDYLQQESLLITQGLSANGTDWSSQHEPQTLLRPTYIHPKSLDHTLMDYERWLFEELHSLGRYHDRVTRERGERISNLNTLHTYLVNNVATDSAAPQSLNDGLDGGDQDGVSDDANVAHEVKVSYESEDEPEDAAQAPADTAEPPELKESSPITVSPDVLHNRTHDDIFAEIESRSFDVSEFLVTPSDMLIKKEPEAEVSTLKTEREDIPFTEDAIDDFIDYFADRSGSLLQQTAADLRDYDESLETLREFRSQLDWLDLKQQEELDLEKYLLENQPIEYDDLYGMHPLLEEKLVLDVKRERPSASTSDASSRGVSEREEHETNAARVKSEPEGDELTQEDVDLIEVLWKQDVDMGFSLDSILQSNLEPDAGLATADKDKVDSSKLDPKDVAKDAVKVDVGKLEAAKEEEDIEKVKAALLEPENKEEDDPWAGLSYTVDSETGEYILQGELPSELVSQDSRFDLLEEALQLVQIGSNRTEHDDGSQPEAEQALKTAEPEAEAEAPPADDMLHPGMARHAPPHHPHHPLAAYHHQSIMRQMSAEQRWQDLATLLTTPEQQYHHQHYHNISGGGYAAHAHNAHYAALAPPPPPHADKPDNYGAAPTLDGGYKVEQPHHHDSIYYQGGGAAAEMTPNPDGLLQSLLSDDDLNLMDMAMNEGMYTMRMLDGGAAHTGHAAHAVPPPTHMMTHLAHERESLSDSAVSSMGSERVASLSDGEWCDAGSDSAQDLHSSKFRPYEASMCRGNASGERAPPQKKHHMFGKRCFQDTPPAESAERPLVKYEYPEQPHPYLHERHPTHAAADYTARVGGPLSQHAPHPAAPLAQPALALHHIPSPHPLCGGGTPGYGYGTPERVRHNHTYSAPHHAPDTRQPVARDKRVRRLTDGSTSDAGSTSGCSRDEKRARALGIPLPVHDIINLPMDEFNERLSKHDLSEAQLSLIRDIRRRGKNKVAAQNCRKRKLDQITSLADEVRSVRDRKLRLQRDHHSLLAERQRVKDRFAALYRHVFQNLRDEAGRPVSSAQYSLQQAADGNVVLVPKMQPEQHMNRSADDDMDRKKHYEQ